MTDKMLDIQIVRAMKVSGPLTRKQIVTRVNENQLDVEATIDAMSTLGCIRAELSKMYRGQFEYHLKTNFGESDCKRSEHRQKIAMYVSHHGSDSKEVLPVTTPGILFSEGLDRGIWRAANTGNWMMVREIRDILTAVGFRRDDIIARVQYHINAGRWFERQAGSRNAQFFKLRDGVECPEVYGSKKRELRGEASSLVVLDDAGFSPATVIASNQNPIAAEVAKPNDAFKFIDGSYFPISMLSAELRQVAIDQAKLLVKVDGTLSEAVWSVLVDGEEYSSADIVTVLRQFGYVSSQVSPLLSKRFAEGLLTRRLVQVEGRWVNVYKKAAELPAKYTMQKSVVSAIVEAQQTTEVEVIAATQAVTKVEPVSTPSLFDAQIRIKGVEISLGEFEYLYKELSDGGFVRDMHKNFEGIPTNRLLSTTHVIKGVTFERDELLQLAKSMYTTANRFKLALVV